MSTFALALLAFHLDPHHGTRHAAIVNASVLVAKLISRLPASAIADRSDRRKVIVGAQAASCGLLLTVVLLDLAGMLDVVGLSVLAGLAGIASSFSLSAEQSALRSVVPTELVTEAVSQIQARHFAAGLLGAPLGGLFFGLHRWLPFLLDGLSFGLAAVCVLLLRADLKAISCRDIGATMRQDIVVVARFLLDHTTLRALVAGAAFLEFADALTQLVVVLKLAQAGVSPALIGMVGAGVGLGGLLGAMVAGRVAALIPTGRLQMLTQLWCSVLLIPISLTNNPYVVAALFVAFMVIVPCSNTAVGGYVMTMTPPHMQGRASGLLAVISNSLGPAGTATGGYVMGEYGAARAVWCGSVAFFLGIAPMAACRELWAVGTSKDWAPDTTEV